MNENSPNVSYIAFTFHGGIKLNNRTDITHLTHREPLVTHSNSVGSLWRRAGHAHGGLPAATNGLVGPLSPREGTTQGSEATVTVPQVKRGCRAPREPQKVSCAMSRVPGMVEGRATASSVLATCHISFFVGAEDSREVTAARSASSWVAMAASGEAVGEAEKKSMLRPSVKPDSHTQPSRA